MPEKLTVSQAQTLINFLRRLFETIVEPLRSDLLAYQLVLKMLHQTKPETAELIDFLVSQTRASSALRESMHNSHLALEKSFQQVLEDVQNLESLEALL